jgi:hypothetical protein
MMRTAPANARSALPGTAAYLGMVQFLFLLTWVVYVIYLESLLATLGLPREFVPRLLLLDQLLFACADVALGFHADRLQRLFGRIAPLVLTLNLVSCVTFVALPHLATGSPGLFVAMTVVWVLTASVLRAPLYGLIARRAAEPGHATAMALLGMGLASALAPYLGMALKEVDPILPFTLSGVSLALATLGFAAYERGLRRPEAPQAAAPPLAPVLRLALVMLLLGAGFQVHFFINSAPLYKGVADPAWLPWLMPVFWIGFSLAVNSGTRLVARQGANRAFVASALLGGAASLACLAAPPLPALIALQALLGAAWGGVFLAGLERAGWLGHTGREALCVGILFAGMAVAAATRILLTLAGVGFSTHLSLPLAAGFWLAGAALGLAWLRPAAGSPGGAGAGNH